MRRVKIFSDDLIGWVELFVLTSSWGYFGETFGEIAVSGVGILLFGETFGEIVVPSAGILLFGETFGEIAVSGAGIWLVGETFGEIAVSGAGIWWFCCSQGGTIPFKPSAHKNRT
jgi:hypothetical protein